MACIVDLFAELGGTPDTGGNWYVTDAPAFPFDMAYGTCPAAATPLTGVVDNDQIGTGEDICVDLAGVGPGDYEFTYVVPSPEGPASCGTDCIGCATVTITVHEAPVDGAPVEYCENDTDAYNLYALLGNAPSTDGNWSCDCGAFTGESDDNLGSNDTFMPSNIGVGVHTFTYTINSDPPGCAECVATIEVTVVEAPSAGTDGVAAVCV